VNGPRVVIVCEVEAPVRVCIVGVESPADAARLQDELSEDEGSKVMAAIRAGLGEAWYELRDRAQEAS
jgi:hypothetical protein